MKKILIFALSLCALISCGKEDIVKENSTPLSFTAGFDESTKTMLNDDRSQSWLVGDQIIVYDVTSQSTISTHASFTNNSSKPSVSATFTIDSGFESFAFETGHKYLALHNATVENYSAERFRILFSNNVTYNSSRKYGMQDGRIPIAYYFTYNSASDLNNFIFHNISALCVVKIVNNSGKAVDVKKINLTGIGSDPARAWGGCIFNSSFMFYNNLTYSIMGWSVGSLSTTITCDDTINNGGIHYYSTFILPVSDQYPGNVDLKVDVISGDGKTIIATDTKNVGTYNQPAKYAVGDTKVITISLNP